MANKTFLRRVPPTPCPILEGLERLEERARKGDVQAAQHFRDIAQRCQKIIEDLPAKITKKPCDPSIPSNKLALSLLEIVKRLKKYGHGGSELDAEIKRLPPLTRESFTEWWKCAWAITKDANFCDDEMNTLIDEIGMDAPSVQKKFQAYKTELIKIIQTKNLAPGTTWQNSTKLSTNVSKQFHAAINVWMKYVRRQTRKAALRVWFEG